MNAQALIPIARTIAIAWVVEGALANRLTLVSTPSRSSFPPRLTRRGDGSAPVRRWNAGRLAD
jgi:hypothetical protein